MPSSLLCYLRKTCTTAARFWVDQNLALHRVIERGFARCHNFYDEVRLRHTLLIVRNCQTVDTVQNNPLCEEEKYTDHRAHLRALDRQAASEKTRFINAPDKLGSSGAASSSAFLQPPRQQHFEVPRTLRPGLLGLPDLSVPTDFVDMAQAAVAECRSLLVNPETFSTPKRAVQTLDLISNTLCNVADAAEFIRQLHPSDRWMISATSAVQLVQNFIGHVNLDSALYQRLRALNEMDSKMSKCLDSQQQHQPQDWVEVMTEEERLVLRLMIDSMEQQGVNQQNPVEKAQCLRLLQQEQQLSMFLAQGSGESHDVWVCKHSAALVLGDHEIDSFPSRRPVENLDPATLNRASDQEIRLPAYHEHAQVLLRHCENPQVRQRIWSAQRLQAKESVQHLIALLTARFQLAQLRNYPSWSHFAKREGIIKTDAGVNILLKRVLEALKPGLHRELQVLQKMKQEWCKQRNSSELSRDSRLYPWDVPFFATQMKQRMWKETSTKLRERLSVHTVINAYSRLTDTLFGVVLNPAVPRSNEVWHWSVLKFHVLRRTSELAYQEIGTLYLDLFDRPGKPSMDAQFSIRGSRMMNYVYRHAGTTRPLDGVGIVSTLRSDVPSSHDALATHEYRQSPCCVLVCNLKSPLYLAKTKDLDRYVRETTMTAAEARNCFHELGHVTHALFSATGLQHLSGTRGAVDFTEFPSHLFEHFVTDHQSLSRVISVQLGDRKLMEQYHQGVHLFGHIEAVQLVLKTAVDMIAHSLPVQTLAVAKREELASEPPGAVSSTAACEKGLQAIIESTLKQRKCIFESVTEPLPDTLVGCNVLGPEKHPYSVMDLVGCPVATRFEHLIHYGGTVHAYLFNRVASAWVWRSGFSRSPWTDMSREFGTRLYTLLSQGSVDTSMGPIVSLLGSETKQEALLEALKQNPHNIPLDDWLEELKESLP